VWEKRMGWKCVSAENPLGRLLGMTPQEAKVELLRLGASYEWL